MRNVAFGRDDTGFSWLSWLSLQLDGNTLSLSFSTLGGVVLDSLQKFGSTLGVLDVFNSQTQSLFQVSVTDHLVDDNTNRRLGDVEDNTGLTLVDLVWHTLLDGTVGLDINDVTNFVDLQVGGQWNSTMLPEVTLEHVTSTRSVTMSI